MWRGKERQSACKRPPTRLPAREICRPRSSTQTGPDKLYSSGTSSASGIQVTEGGGGKGGGREGSYFADFFHCRRVVCAVLFRLFGTVGLCNKLQTQKKKTIYLFAPSTCKVPTGHSSQHYHYTLDHTTAESLDPHLTLPYGRPQRTHSYLEY